jgi:hypothetical protein
LDTERRITHFDNEQLIGRRPVTATVLLPKMSLLLWIESFEWSRFSDLPPDTLAELMMRQRIWKLIAFCCVLTLGCRNEVKTTPSFSLSAPAPVDWDMSPTDAVNVATRYAADNDIPLDAYDEPSVSGDVFEGDRFWAVLYQGKTRMPGNHFMLLINDETRTVEYIPGE